MVSLVSAEPGGGPPGDFDGDGNYNISDVILIKTEIIAGTNNPFFDLNSDALVNLDDFVVWLTNAGNHNVGYPYGFFDLDFSGTVSAADFSQWNTDRFTFSQFGYCAGDINLDGVIDVLDLRNYDYYRGTSGQQSIPSADIATGGIPGDGAPDITYDPDTGRMAIFLDGCDIAGLVIDGPNGNNGPGTGLDWTDGSVSDPGHVWVQQYLAGREQWYIASPNQFRNLTNQHFVINQYAPGLSAMDFGNVYVLNDTLFQSPIVTNVVIGALPNLECPTLIAVDTNAPIPDVGTYTDTIFVNGFGSVRDVDLGVTINHADLSNVRIRLFHNDVSVTVWEYDCGPGDNMDVVFDDEGVPYQCGVSDFYLPLNSLSVFDGMEAGGDWTLNVSDFTPGAAGTLIGWAVDVEAGEDCNGNGIADGCDISSGSIQDCQGDGIPDDCQLFGDGPAVFEQSPQVDIPDNSTTGVSDSIFVDGSFTVTDLNIGLEIAHTWTGDLCVSLEHDNLSADLVVRIGDDSDLCEDSPALGCSSDDLSIVLDDEGKGGPIELLCSGTSTPPSPPGYLPQEPLSIFDGVSAEGLWTLTVKDVEQADIGTLQSWSLIFDAAANNDCDDDGVPDDCQYDELFLSDCDGDGVSNVCEIINNGVVDCDANGIPDECETIAQSGPATNRAWGAAFTGSEILGTFRIDAPEDGSTVVQLLPPTALEAGDFGPGSETGSAELFYALSTTNPAALYSIDVSTDNGITVDGPANLLPGQQFSSMAWDHVRNKMWAVAKPDDPAYENSLYSINLSTGSSTFIGNLNHDGIRIVALAIDNEGRLFAFDNANDMLGEIDPTSGQYSPVGPVGFDTSVDSVGMDFDLISGRLMMACYNTLAGSNELREVNPETGFSTLVGPLDYEYLSLAIASSLPVNDCNDNGILDTCEFASGDATDCNNDDTPDACELGAGAQGTYAWDDGSSLLGIEQLHNELILINNYDVKAGAEVLHEIEVLWGDGVVPTGMLYVWSDPNQDGNPNDAQLVFSQEVNIPLTPPSSFESYPIPPIAIGPVGTSFFVGLGHTGNLGQFTTIVDRGSPFADRGWSVASTSTPLNPDNLGSQAYDAPLRSHYSQYAASPEVAYSNLTIRAMGMPSASDCNGNETLDECETGEFVLVEPFDSDASSGVVWTESFINAAGYVGGEIGSALMVFDIEHLVFEELALVTFSTAIPPQENFMITARITWDDQDLLEMMDTVSIVASNGSVDFASAGYQDAWLASRGQLSFVGGGVSEGTGPDSMPFAATLDVGISKMDGQLTFWRDGQAVFSGTSTETLEEVQLRFGYYPFAGPPMSQLGTLTVESLTVREYTAVDCNGNGIPDDCEMYSDCDGNSLPDECQTDCNFDATIDACDPDCNGNGSDVCELLNGAPDCNANGVPDDCDIASMTEEDQNGDGIPDSCEASYTVTVEALGCRAVSVTPVSSGPSDGSEGLAIRMTSPDHPCLNKYLTPDGFFLDFPIFFSAEQWGPVVVTSESIVPESTYVFSADLTTAEGEPTATDTWKWGDLDNNGFANFSDILLLVQAFQGNFENVTIWAADLAPCEPNGLANFEDILLDVQAFQGQTYADTGCPLPCP